MKRTDDDGTTRYRVWIAEYENWRPGGLSDVPPKAIALEPAEEETMSADQAATYVEAFNGTALSRPGRKKVWAMAMPVAVRYEGEPRPGQVIGGGSAGSQRNL